MQFAVNRKLKALDPPMKGHRTCGIGSWVGLMIGLDVVEKWKRMYLLLGLDLRTVNPVALVIIPTVCF